MRDRALLITFGGLGNAVLLSPLYAALAPRMPVDILYSAPVVREYFAAAPGGGELLAWADTGWKGLWQQRGRWSHAVVAAAMSPLRGAALALCSGAAHRIGEGYFGFTVPVAVRRPEEHELQRNLNLAAAAGFAALPQPLVWAATRDVVPPLPARYVALHAGCGDRLRGKRWPLERFAAVTRELTAAGISVVAVGGPDECGLGATLDAAGALDLTGKLTLAKTAGVLREAALYLGNDSGLMHLAAATGTRCLALFGPTRETKNAPWGDSHRVLTASVACRPCYRNRPIDCRHGFACLQDITVAQVVSAVQEMLA